MPRVSNQTTKSFQTGKRRSETVSVRLDPKLRYLAELAARKQRRTLSSFVEWAIECSLAQVNIEEGPNWRTTIKEAASNLWDVDDAERFVRLAYKYPDMLTHTEQVLWKLVRENGYLWRGRYGGPLNEWMWDTNNEGDLIKEHLRKTWHIFNGVANGQMAEEYLPTWCKTLDEAVEQGTTEGSEEDIPE